jgi:hypothetical protein
MPGMDFAKNLSGCCGRIGITREAGAFASFSQVHEIVHTGEEFVDAFAR